MNLFVNDITTVTLTATSIYKLRLRRQTWPLEKLRSIMRGIQRMNGQGVTQFPALDHTMDTFEAQDVHPYSIQDMKSLLETSRPRLRHLKIDDVITSPGPSKAVDNAVSLYDVPDLLCLTRSSLRHLSSFALPVLGMKNNNNKALVPLAKIRKLNSLKDLTIRVSVTDQTVPLDVTATLSLASRLATLGSQKIMVNILHWPRNSTSMQKHLAELLEVRNFFQR